MAISLYKRSWKVTKAFKFYVFNCVRGSEVCIVQEKHHSKKMHGLGAFKLKKKKYCCMMHDRRGQNITIRFVSLR